MTLSTLPELQAQFVALTARIAALDRDIALDAADIMLAGGTPTADHVEERVTALERDVRRLWGMIKPGPRQAVARVVFFVLLGVCWSMWMIKEVRDWFIAHPLQAIAISLAMLVAALIIRWLPEDEHHDQR